MHEERIEAIIARFFSDLDSKIEDLISDEFSQSEIQSLNVNQIAEGLNNYFKKESRVAGAIFARQHIIESQFTNILMQFQDLSRTARSISDLQQSFEQLRTEYNASIGSMKISVDSVKNSADILSSSVTRIDQNIGRLATNDGIKALLSEAEKSLVSKQDLDNRFARLTNELNSTKSDIEEKLKKVESGAWMQFGILIAGLLLGFLGVVATLFATVYPLLQNSQKINSSGSIEQPVKRQPTSSP